MYEAIIFQGLLPIDSSGPVLSFIYYFHKKVVPLFKTCLLISFNWQILELDKMTVSELSNGLIFYGNVNSLHM